MKNKNLFQRTLVCIIGIPFLFAITVLLPQKNFIGLSLLAIAASAVGSVEMSKLVYKKTTLTTYTSCFLPLVSYLKPNYTEFVLVFLVFHAFSLEVKCGEQDNFEKSITRIAKRLLITIYPSYLITFLIRTLSFDVMNCYVIIYYILLVFSNDIFAYIFGTIFGRNNNAHLKSSPKKSWAGFIGGMLYSICFSLVFTLLFADKVEFFTDIIFRLLCPVMLCVMADIGDLAESVLKRCANVKDSSNLIPGHGGLLDRLDSILFTAPVFFFLIGDFL